jgi:hypothetical protein
MARKAFAHDAVVTMRGGVIANALCGGWDHRPPCPLAPHFVSYDAIGETVTVRVVFATEPENEHRVRGLIGEALASGRLTVPDGGVAHWELRSATAGALRGGEHNLAESLIAH